MGYELRLERREARRISFAEWQETVERNTFLRLSPEDTHWVVNPTTGERIGRSSTPGDTEIWFEDQKAWVQALYWRDGRIFCNATPEFMDESSFIRILLRDLAAELDASIIGEEGERYQ